MSNRLAFDTQRCFINRTDAIVSIDLFACHDRQNYITTRRRKDECIFGFSEWLLMHTGQTDDGDVRLHSFLQRPNLIVETESARATERGGKESLFRGE